MGLLHDVEIVLSLDVLLKLSGIFVSNISRSKRFTDSCIVNDTDPIVKIIKYLFHGTTY